MGLFQKAGDSEFFRAARQAIAALGAVEGEPPREPVTLALEHVVAAFAIDFHVVALEQVAEPQNFGNVDILRSWLSDPAPYEGDLCISGGFTFVAARFIEPSLRLDPMADL